MTVVPKKTVLFTLPVFVAGKVRSGKVLGSAGFCRNKPRLDGMKPTAMHALTYSFGLGLVDKCETSAVEGYGVGICTRFEEATALRRRRMHQNSVTQNTNIMVIPPTTPPTTSLIFNFLEDEVLSSPGGKSV